MGKQRKGKTRREDKRVRDLRKEVEALLAKPEFQRTSKAFRQALAQRLGIKEFEDGGLVIQAPAPVSLREIAKESGVDLRHIEDYLDTPCLYGNIYSYSFW